MPYIIRARREHIKRNWSDEIDAGDIRNAGELNFAISTIINLYLKHNGKDYQHMNDIIGALEGAKAEFYRIVVVPYENEKLKKNGEVFDV